jgi:hypothetical protein
MYHVMEVPVSKSGRQNDYLRKCISQYLTFCPQSCGAVPRVASASLASIIIIIIFNIILSGVRLGSLGTAATTDLLS